MTHHIHFPTHPIHSLVIIESHPLTQLYNISLFILLISPLPNNLANLVFMLMGLDDICNTTLVLGLGLTVKSEHERVEKRPLGVGGGFEPCLRLGLSEEPYCDTKGHAGYRMLHRQEDVTSSFCNGVVVKRERETETERVSSRASDDGLISNSRKKLRLNKDQSAVLEESFKEHSTLNPKQKQELARKLNLSARQVEVWFQNRRARTKLKQTEVDCEFLKNCCETLTKENQRLQKEIQELKALKFAQPLYMHMPAMALTVCPSCESVSGDNKTPKTPLITVSGKAHFLINPVIDPSAAC